MRFEVYRNGQRLFVTENKKCIPQENSIKQMLAAGYKVLLDGKAYKPQKRKKA
nr:MAG TPA: hypothetical protein [Caudoviricetes sp.]